MFGTKAVIPLQIGLTAIRKTNFNGKQNDEALAADLDLVEEWQEATWIKIVAYHQELAKGYNQDVRIRKFQSDDFVLRKQVVENKNRHHSLNLQIPAGRQKSQIKYSTLRILA